MEGTEETDGTSLGLRSLTVSVEDLKGPPLRDRLPSSREVSTTCQMRRLCVDADDKRATGRSTTD